MNDSSNGMPMNDDEYDFSGKARNKQPMRAERPFPEEKPDDAGRNTRSEDFVPPKAFTTRASVELSYNKVNIVQLYDDLSVRIGGAYAQRFTETQKMVITLMLVHDACMMGLVDGDTRVNEMLASIDARILGGGFCNVIAE